MLLADDDRLILATLSQGLRSAGFPTIEAASGREALQLCLQSPPDIAILDYELPDISGLEVARALQPAAFPLIFLSAYGDDQIARAAADLGVMAYLVKPIDPVQLVPAIHTAILRFSELAALRGESAQLNAALKAARTTSIVVGLLMERLKLTEKDAYDRLRQYCRSHNRKITEVALEILGTTERMHSLLAAIAAATDGRPP
ncbi:MAG TPA: response regulator [Steroidobacteraceae bacterium]|nr:response regulator [Steroidobacteraceae bacterium]